MKLQPNNCICGSKAKVVDLTDLKWGRVLYCVCLKEDCFQGPSRKTHNGAVKIWNKVMK